MIQKFKKKIEKWVENYVKKLKLEKLETEKIKIKKNELKKKKK